MLSQAHLYTHHYKLRLGHRDRLGEHMTNLLHASGMQIGKRNSNLDLDTYRSFWKGIQLNERSPQFKSMISYVPRRLLLPFLSTSITNLHRTKKHAALDSEFGRGWQQINKPPLYFYSYEKLEVYVPRQWCNYLSKHFSIMQDWVMWELSCYLTKRNPTVPCLVSKLMPPHRGPMNKQKQLWQLVSGAFPNQLRCPYSPTPLTAKHVIDHFIPHSFVHHDLPWNLVPTTSQANSAKSDRLPSLTKYMTNFLDMQELAITVLTNQPVKLQELAEAYEFDIFEGDKLTQVKAHPKHLRSKLSKTIKRNHDMAASQGYPTW